jgi:hypothetical protein
VDPDPVHPREDFDHLGTMVCFHRRYSLGDIDHGLSLEEAKELEARDDVISLPLYLYDHSGLTMNTTGFSCPWDSGKVGFIYVTKERAEKEGVPDPEALLRAEVKEYDQYLRGEVYGYRVLDEAGKELDSCWGFYGDYNVSGILDQARSVVDAELAKTGEQLVLSL